jgi:hypothetical protein
VSAPSITLFAALPMLRSGIDSHCATRREEDLMRNHPLLIVVAALTFGGCASNTITPDYSSTDPNVQVGGEQPADTAPTKEDIGSFCMEVSQKWHEDGETPDGKKLWSRDTFRKVVPCE